MLLMYAEINTKPLGGSLFVILCFFMLIWKYERKPGLKAVKWISTTGVLWVHNSMNDYIALCDSWSHSIFIERYGTSPCRLQDANALVAPISPDCFRTLPLVEESITKCALLRPALAKVTSCVTCRISSSELKSTSTSDLATESCSSVGGMSQRKSSL